MRCGKDWESRKRDLKNYLNKMNRKFFFYSLGFISLLLACYFGREVYLQWQFLDAFKIFWSLLLATGFFLIKDESSQKFSFTGDLIALIHSFCPLFFSNQGKSPIPLLALLPLFALGVSISLLGYRYLGKSISIFPRHRGIKINGIYAWIRHPIYAGYLITGLAWSLWKFSLWNSLTWLLFFGLTLWRASIEEKTLKQDFQYQEYCRRVPYRLIPKIL